MLNETAVLLEATLALPNLEWPWYLLYAEVLRGYGRVFGMRVYVHPQLRSTNLRRGRHVTVIPDLTVTHLRTRPRGFIVLSGVEIKRENLGDLPSPGDAPPSWTALILQAAEQVRSLVMEGKLTNSSHPWIVAMGRYFHIRRFGPFSSEELGSTSSPVAGGDFAMDATDAWMDLEPEFDVWDVCSPEGAQVMGAFVRSLSS